MLTRLAERVHSRTGELVDPADGSGIADYVGDSLRHVLDKDWLQPGVTAADQRQYRQESGELGERAEQCVARSEHGAGRTIVASGNAC